MGASGGNALLVLATVAAVLFAAFYRNLLSAQPRPAKPAPRRRPESPPPRRSITLRVDLVPVDTAPEALEGQLRARRVPGPDLQAALATACVRSLVRSQPRFACATVALQSSLPEGQLLAALHQGNDGLPYRYDSTFQGITPLHADADAKCDLVAVPGLASHALGTWKVPGGHDVWLRDWLPGDIPKLRVLVYGYDTAIRTNESRASIEDLGRRLLASLSAFRASTHTETRPLVFLAHSLGGLLVKEALVHSSKGVNERDKLIWYACRHLLFFGVPHLGLRNESLATLVEGRPNQALIRSLVVDSESEPSEFLSRIAHDFSACFQGRRRVVSFYEQKRSPTVQVLPDGTLQKSGPLALLVTKKSATTTGVTTVLDEDNIPLNTDHSGLVKFQSRAHDDYCTVRERIRVLVSRATSLPEDEAPAGAEPQQERRTGYVQYGSTITGDVNMTGGSLHQGNSMNVR